MSLTLILFVCIAVSKATIAAIAEYCAYCLPLSAASANTAIFHTLFFFLRHFKLHFTGATDYMQVP